MGQHPAAWRSQTASDRLSGAEPRRQTAALLIAYLAAQVVAVAIIAWSVL